MAITIQVDIVSAEGCLFSGKAIMVVIPVVMGTIGVLPRHAPFLSPLQAGEVRVKVTSEQEDSFYVSSGFVEVQPSAVTILADSAMRARDLDEAAALAAKQRAEKLLAKQQNIVDHAQAEALLKQALAQLQTIIHERMRRQIRPLKESGDK
jgi:F-type H+-transporting ATPase subunit epsilon